MGSSLGLIPLTGCFVNMCPTLLLRYMGRGNTFTMEKALVQFREGSYREGPHAFKFWWQGAKGEALFWQLLQAAEVFDN